MVLLTVAEIAWVAVAIVPEVAAVVGSVTGVAVAISTDVAVLAAAKVVVGNLAVDAKVCCAEVDVIDLVLGVIVVAVREKSIDAANSGGSKGKSARENLGFILGILRPRLDYFTCRTIKYSRW